MREDRLLELSDVASGQWGLFTSAQAKAVGVTVQQLARLATDQVIQRLRHGVYRLAGVPEDPRTALRATWLALDPTRTAAQRSDDPAGVVSHRSAAWLHGLGDLDADRLEFSVAERRQSRRRDTRFHVRKLDSEEWELVNGLPVTTVVSTVRDLARAGIDGGHLAGVVRDALLDAHVDFDALVAELRPYAHRYGAPLGDGEALVADLLEQAGVPTSTLKAAAAGARTIKEMNEMLASPMVAQNLRYLQSPALHQNLAQMQDLIGQAIVFPAREAMEQAMAALPPDLIGHDIAAWASRALAAQTESAAAALREAAIAPALEAAQRAAAAPIHQAVTELAAQLAQSPTWDIIDHQVRGAAETLRRAQEAASDQASRREDGGAGPWPEPQCNQPDQNADEVG